MEETVVPEDGSPGLLVEESDEVLPVIRFCELNVTQDPTKDSTLNKWFVLVLAETGEEYVCCFARKNVNRERGIWFSVPESDALSWDDAVMTFLDRLSRYHTTTV